MKPAETPCRICGKRNLQLILSLGETPLANSLLRKAQLGEPEPRFPLDLYFCTACALVQISETVPPEKLFREYLYFSSFSDTAVKSAETLARRMTREKGMGQSHLVIELASNDGYLLQFYRKQSVQVLGIEPAQNIARFANERGINTISEFFGAGLARQLADNNRQADVIHANNVLAHVADTNDFVAGIKLLLKPGGTVVIEAPYVKDTIDGVEFDQIYHEHLCYFSLTSLTNLFARHGLTVVDVERLPIHGGTLRVFVEGAERASVKQSVTDLLRKEESWGVNDLSFYQTFGERVEQLRENLLMLLHDLKSQDKKIAAYGASAKGSTLLNYFGIGRETLDFVADRSTVKQGLFTPGTHLPIVAPESLLREKPDYVLLLTWNFADEILSQQDEFRQQGGKFIVPIPSLEIK